MWFIATLGIAAESLGMLIPWSLGIVPTINVELSRMLFWYFGHPLVYFWIMGAYLLWYNVLPVTYGGKTFSDSLTRIAFLFLLILSTPVGLHHQFLEPGVSATWKWVHTFTTFGVVIPSFMTAFAIFASFEIAARRQGRKGFVATVAGLPWDNPTFTGSALGMILFIFGGLGGIVNASYSLDVLVHNTMWIVGHFHITVGGPVALTFLGAAYWLVPALTGRKLWAPKLALLQTYTWFVGMVLMSVAMHWAGILGSPRRTSDVDVLRRGSARQSWHRKVLRRRRRHDRVRQRRHVRGRRGRNALREREGIDRGRLRRSGRRRDRASARVRCDWQVGDCRRHPRRARLCGTGSRPDVGPRVLGAWDADVVASRR